MDTCLRDATFKCWCIQSWGDSCPVSLQARPSTHAKPTYFGTVTRRLQQLPTPESFEPAVPEETQAFAAQAPTSAPGMPPRGSSSLTESGMLCNFLHLFQNYFWKWTMKAGRCARHQAEFKAVDCEGHADLDRWWCTGGEEGPRFQALPEPAPLPPLPRPTQPMSDAPAPAPMAEATADYQVRFRCTA